MNATLVTKGTRVIHPAERAPMEPTVPPHARARMVLYVTALVVTVSAQVGSWVKLAVHPVRVRKLNIILMDCVLYSCSAFGCGQDTKY